MVHECRTLGMADNVPVLMCRICPSRVFSTHTIWFGLMMLLTSSLIGFLILCRVRVAAIKKPLLHLLKGAFIIGQVGGELGYHMLNISVHMVQRIGVRNQCQAVNSYRILEASQRLGQVARIGLTIIVCTRAVSASLVPLK
jgi:hypothetical protein